MFLACVLTIAIVAIVKSSICFIVKSLGLHLAKVRLSERSTKEKYLFLLNFRAGVPWTDRSEVRISERKAKEKLKFSLLVSSQHSCRDISPFTLLRSKAMLTLFVLKDVVQVGHDGLQVFVSASFTFLMISSAASSSSSAKAVSRRNCSGMTVLSFWSDVFF